jgi:outer membrane receptor protein involved in Fe transport
MMATNTTLSRAVRLALVTAAVYGTAAVAQDTEIEQIVVTGSRISTNALDSAAPLQIITSEAIQATGAVNVQDLLLKSPEFGTPTISRTNSNFQTSSVGVATVDLRNLGTSRTLTLVDGRRFVAGIPGDTAVDYNTIPTNFIERVDVLTGGASALYGSDAIAGVVNLIYKRDYEGVELDAQFGSTGRGDNETTDISVTMGTNLADGRGNIMGFIGYSDQGAVYSRDRSRSNIDQISLGLLTGDVKDVFKAQRPFYSSFAPTGRFYRPNGTNYTYDANGNVVPWSTNGSATVSAKGFNRSEFRTIAVPTERWNAAAKGFFEFTDNHEAFFEITYAGTSAISELEPYPLNSTDVFDPDGYVPLQTAQYIPRPGGGFDRIVLNNPTVPAYTLANSVDQDGDGLIDLAYFSRRMKEIGNRGNKVDRNTFNGVVGLQGKLFDEKWNYNAFYTYGQTSEAQTSSGQVNVLNFRNALQAIPDVNDIDGDGNRSEAICADAIARAQGCVPANIYGAGSLSPAAVAYISAPGSYNTFIELNVLGLTMTGELFDLPAGAVSTAFGGEYRSERSRAEFDVLQQQGLNAGNAILPTYGKYFVGEAFAEVNIPILKDVFMAERLDLRGAYRYSDYSTVGGENTWNAGFEWQPISQLRFRGTAAQAVRAPNINELFAPAAQDFPPGLSDPCVGTTLTSNRPQDAACRAAPGVLANIQANGSFTLNQQDLQGISGYDTGNPDLGAEKGNTWTIGLVYTPENVRILENFAFSVDYWDIEIKDAIVPLPEQFTLDGCYTNDPSLCQYITRRPNVVGGNSSGSLEFVNQPTFNSGGVRTSGVDFVMTYAQDLENWGYGGGFSGRLSYTYTIDGESTPVPGADVDPYVGEIGAPENKAYLALIYNIADFSLNWNLSYIGESCLDDQFLRSTFDTGPNSACVDAEYYSDVQLQYSPGEHYELFVGASNLFDNNPPPILTGVAGTDTGTETNAGTYDPIGRTYYGGVRVKF